MVALGKLASVQESPLVTPEAHRWYCRGQEIFGVSMGDVVKLMRIAKTGEMGWCNIWPTTMTPLVGHLFTVIGLGPTGVQLKPIEPFHEHVTGLAVPWFVLQRCSNLQKVSIGERTYVVSEELANKVNDFLYVNDPDLTLLKP